ncbi:hypothetical protein FRB90_008721, partial [Tulasnella sp. 427]
DKPDPVAAEKEGILFLATSIFSTCERHTFWWFTDLPRHLAGATIHWGYENEAFTDLRCVSVPRGAVQPVADLVQLAGLDPKAALPKDMDDLDFRFWCKDCVMVGVKGPTYARNWRNCVLHLEQHSVMRPFRSWKPVSAEDRATIAIRETAACRLENVDWNQVAISLDGHTVTWTGEKYTTRLRHNPNHLDVELD